MVREITTRWTVAKGAADILSVMYFADGGGGATVAEQREAVHNMWLGCLPNLQNTTSYVVETTGRSFNTATGAITGEWSDPVAHQGSGIPNAGSSVANASQVLLRWKTGQIVGSRFLQGRTFVPGLASGALSQGEIPSVIAGVFANAASGLILSDVGFGIWHRPKGGAGGAFWPAQSVSVWNEVAVLRRRR